MITIYRLVLSVPILVLASCTTIPEKTFGEFSQDYETMKKPAQERVIFPFNAACNEETGMCLVKKTTLDRAASVITKFNDTVDNLISSANTRLESIMHCEYANYRYGKSIEYLENAQLKTEATNTIKSLLGAGACGVLLWAK
jgi:hypothetical protein|tara:strand:+ start:30 stop:455 length:426 start_codon:yes stop_codon:yes gene_type:complete